VGAAQRAISGWPSTDRVAAGVQAWAHSEIGCGARVRALRPMPGNGGLSFGFTVREAGTDRRFVIRLAPPGVPRHGNTDVLRQVPLLAALADAAIPVPAVVWSARDSAWFGTDAIIQQWIPGRPLHMFDPSSGVTASDPMPLVGRAVEILADIHRVRWEDVLGTWEPPRGADEEIDFWLPLMARAADAVTVRSAETLATRLKDGRPQRPPLGLLHGDFQTHNIIYRQDGGIRAVIDWELAGIGSQLLDLGWLSMMTDPAAWAPEHAKRMRVVVSPAWLRGRYEQARAAEVDDFDWYRSLACYRFAVITAFNLRLHRTGRRIDAWYEDLESSVPALLEHGQRLAG
jgi:aminoglycoside phosphotransferase (APT) family kinase protein